MDTLSYIVEPHRDPKYLEYIRSLPCCITEKTGSVDPHHVFTGGVSLKCSDYFTIPLDHEKHEELHRIGKESFILKYDINIKNILLKCMANYINWLTERDK